MKTRKILSLLMAVMLLLGMLPMGALAAENTDIYVSVTGTDENAGTASAPVFSLNKAMELVENGGTVHIADSYTAPADFVWDSHEKDVTITGGKLDLSQAGETVNVDKEDKLFVYQGDAVTFDNMELVLANKTNYCANGNRLQINENVTVTGADLQLYGGGANGNAVASTDVKLLGGSYLRVYGGGYRAAVTGDVNLYVGAINAGHKVAHDGTKRVHGGGYYANVGGDINLTIAGATADFIDGGSNADCTISGDVNVLMTSGTLYSLYGGGYKNNIQGNINLTMAGGTVAQVFGANRGANRQGDVLLSLKGGSITRRFFGGCYNDVAGTDNDFHVIGNVDVCIYEDMNFAWNTAESDRGFYAHSRYGSLFGDEVTAITFMGTAAQAKHEDNLGSQNLGMTLVMGSANAADDISVFDMTTKVETWNVILGDDIGANFYVNVPESVAKNSVLNVTVAGKTESYDLAKHKPDEDGLYEISVNVAAAQMTENITLQLVSGGKACEAVSYTVRQYADAVLNGDYSAEAKQLVEYMLHYGAAAQKYFAVNTDNLANAGHELDNEVQLPAQYEEMSVEGQLGGVTFYGASLVFESKIALRYYFTADSVEGVTFTANGVNYSAKEKNGKFYVEVPGINPQNYSDSIVLSAVKGEETLNVSYSPLNYMIRMSEKGSDTLKVLVGAMYRYHEAAVAYVGACSATIVLPNVTGGKVIAEKNAYLPGETVTITATPDSAYNMTALTIYKNGEAMDIGQVSFAGGSYSFVAESGNYTVDATFAEKIFQDADNWDLTGQYDGVVTIKEGYEKGRTLRTYASKYRDIAVTVKDFQEGTFKAELHFVFGEDREFQIRLHNENTNGEYRVQKMATTQSSGWKNLYTLSEAEAAALTNEGVRFRVVMAGTKALAYINGTQIGEVDLAEQITATELAQIKMVMYGNNGVEDIAIPFALGGIFQNTVHYDLTNQNNGSVVLLEGYEKGRTLKTNESDYRDVALTVKHLAEDTFKAEYHFTFGEGKAFQIRLHNEGTNGEYRVQKMATDLSTGWKNLYTLNASEVEALKSDGVQFRVVIADTYAIAFINGKQVGVVDLTGGITTEMAQITMILYGNVGVQNIVIPFALGKGAASATVQIAETTNGTVKVNKAVCLAGDTVTLTATPDEGYYLAELSVNGESVAVSGNKYSFVAQGSYTVNAVFGKKIFQDTAHYDLTNQNNGSVVLLEGYDKGRTLKTEASSYRELTATVKHLAEDTFKAEYHFTFGEGKVFQIRLHNENTNGEYRVQKMATDLSTGWKNLYTLNASEVEALKSEGVEFRVVIADTYAIAFINGKQVGVVDLTGGITTEMAQITMIMYGNVGVQNIAVPFTLGQGAASATVQIAETTNGTVKVNKAVCLAGDTVTLTATPDEGYYLAELTVNGEAVAVSSNKYSFVAQSGIYTVNAVFSEKIFQDTAHYDLTNQNNGSVILLEGYEKGRTLKTEASSYRDFAATVKHLAEDTFKAEYHFTFGEGKAFQIRLHNEGTNGEYRVQKMATDLSTGWKNLYTLNASEVEALKSEGVEFRVVIAGTNAIAYINGKQVGVVDLTGGITTEMAQIIMIMYGNVGVQSMEIPFALGEGPAISTVTVAEGITNGEISVNKNFFVEGETVTITATAAEGYNLKSLVVKCDGQVVQNIETKLAGGTYSYVIAGQGAYTVEAEYAAPLFRFQNDTDKKNWNVDNQYAGLLTILGKTKATGGYARIITAESTYKEASVTVSDLAPTYGADGKGNFQMQIRFKFANGKEYHVRLHNTDADGKYKVQSMKNNDNCITGWKWLKDLSAAQTEAMLDGTGVNFRAALEGSNAVIYLDGTRIATVDLSAGDVTADSTAEITFIMYGNDGVEPIALPFTLG